MKINQYQIILVNLDPTVGSEIKKSRHCVVIPNEMNKFLQTIVIAPFTINSKSYPTRVKIFYNNTKSWLVIDQIRTVDKQRITKVFEHLLPLEITKIKSIIKETIVD